MKFVLCFICVVLLGCQRVIPSKEHYENNDSLKSFNTVMLDFNLFMDDLLLKPLSYMYKEGVPTPIQRSINNVFIYVKEPSVFANSLLQGEGETSLRVFARFLLNTTFGLLGVFDVAAHFGLPEEKKDFGQTLALWGVPSGPYLVLPFIGPTTPRDFMGFVVDYYTLPVDTYLRKKGYREYIYGKWALELIRKRASIYDEFEDMKKTSLDLYSSIKAVYEQHRHNFVYGEPLLSVDLEEEMFADD